MERSSSQRDLRSERLSRTPYTRPEPSRLRKSASMTPFATLKSIVNYVSSPFTRTSSSSAVLPTHSTSNELAVRVPDVDIDQRSESGSEDEWNGEPPSKLEGQDIFSLAAAAGRGGDEFDKRAASWRNKGEVLGGKRQLNRLALQNSSSELKQLEPSTPTAPGHFNFLKSSPSMPALSQSSTLQIPSASTKRPRSPLAGPEFSSSALPQRTPLPSSFVNPAPTTPANTQDLSSSASSVALTAFLEAKKGQQMTPEDFRVIETLTENMKAESHLPGQTPPEKKHGGWAAGSYPSGSAIKSSQSFASFNTPDKRTENGNAQTPGTVFSVGSTTPRSINQSSPYRQRYLGPGMSPRRMFPQPKKSNLKPLFNFGAEEEDTSKGKKRKTNDEEEVMDVDQNTSSTSKGLSSSASMPSLSAFSDPSANDKGKNKLSVPSHTPARPSPLSRNISSPGSVTSTTPVDEKARKKAEAEAAGKKRAAEIIMDIIDEEIGPVIPTRKAEPVIFNPYDRTSLNPSPAPAVPLTVPSTAFAGSTPRKSKGSFSPARRTPARGAAAKLELHKEAMKGSKPLTTIERIQGVKPWEKAGSPVRSSKDRVETPTPDEDIIEIDELVDESEASSSRAPTPAPAPVSAPPIPPAAAVAKIPAAETFKPFSPPTITFNNQPPPQSQPAVNAVDTSAFDSPMRKSIIQQSSSSGEGTIPKPTFSFNEPSPAPSPADEEMQEERREVTEKPGTGENSKLDLNRIYLSAKDSALKISKPALPFFTFTLPPRPLESTPKKEVLEEAKKRDQPTFEFSLTASSTTKVTAPAAETQWTCGTCMLKNPDSAKEKCTICEEPRPKASSAASSVSSTSTLVQQAKKNDDQWICGTCMLKNPDSAKEKCTICDAPRPASTQTSSSGGKTSGQSGFTGFASGFGPKKTEGTWTCPMCMLQNPESAKDKCTICDTPR
ncbi:uncharacterized protein L199_005165 [Kwoniella botswanensis]|uniref:uncharacterized protein n=1 Tax=Kwoniella botswanensis TaxID=1268659 RepID=UPI00315CFF8A